MPTSTEPTALTKGTRGPKLKPDQVRIIQELIVTYWEVSTVQAVLREEHPDILPITDTMIRTYRRDLDQAMSIAEADAITNRILTTGLANRSVRVAQLKNLWQRCARSLDSKRQLTDKLGNPIYDQAGQPVVEVQLRADVVREMREIAVQIAREVGQALPPVTQLNVTNNTLVVPGVPSAVDVIDDVRRLLEEEEAMQRAG